MLGLSVKLAQNLHASFHLVALHTLGNQQLDTALVVVAQHSHEVLRLVVLTSQAQHQYATGIGVQTDVAQHLAGVLVVLRELRAAIVVVPSPYGINTFFFSLFTKLFGQTLGSTVHTAHSGHNPYFVAHTNIAVLTDISLKGSLFVFNAKFLVYRLVCVFKRSA